MKAIFISFNQAYYETIVNIMDRNNLKGFTYWDVVQGRGSKIRRATLRQSRLAYLELSYPYDGRRREGRSFSGNPTQLRQGNGSARASGLRLEYRENYLT